MSRLPNFPLPDPPPSQARLEALYASSAAQRESNPTGYAANAAWWGKVLELSLLNGGIDETGNPDTDQTTGGDENVSKQAGSEDAGDKLVFKLDEGFGRRFEWNGRVPKGLAGVVETITTAQPPALTSLSAYQSAATPILAPPSLTSRLVARPLWWAVSQLNPFGHTGPLSKEEDAVKAYGRGKEYVHLGLMQEAAAKYKQYIASHPTTSFSDSIHDVASFRATYGGICLPVRTGSIAGQKTRIGAQGSLSRRDVELLAKWLMRDEGVVVTDGTIIRILENGQAVADHPITEVERGIMSVKNALRKVELQIEGVEAQVAGCQVKTKTYLSSNQRNLAMSQLRTKKALEEVLDKRAGVVEQLRSVLRGIDQASSDAEVMAAYELSTSTLKTLLANPLLDRERVDSATDALAESLADQREIDEAIQQGSQVAIGANGRVLTDDDELEKELADMVRDEKERVEAEKQAEQAAERLQREDELERKRMGADAARLAGLASPPVAATRTGDGKVMPDQTGSRTAGSEWEERYAASRAREIAEKGRAEVERLQKEEERTKRVAAE